MKHFLVDYQNLFFFTKLAISLLLANLQAKISAINPIKFWSNNIFVMIMIRNCLFNLINLCVIVSFFD